MTDAETAFETAREMIAEAKREGWDSLNFDRVETRALTRLPEEIGTLDGLTTLSLNNTDVSDLAPLAGLTDLTVLYLRYTAVSDIAPLTGLTGLTTLYLSGTGVSDLAPLAGLTGLEMLHLDDTGVSDLAPLAGLTGLTTLYLSGTGVSDLTPLAGLTELTVLILNRTSATDISALAGLTALVELYLNATGVSDLAPLVGLTGLKELYLNSSRVSDLAPLAGLTNLKILDLDNSDVRDLRPLSGLRQLADTSEGFGLTFRNCAATRLDDRVREISEIEIPATRARELFDYLKTWEPPKEAGEIEAVLQGPILSDSLVDIEKSGERFEATALADEPARPKDQDYDDLVQLLSYASARLGQVEADNRIGRETGESLRDYSRFVGQETVNARVLNFLAQGIRAILADEMLRESLDGFDETSLTDFLANHDRLIASYYPKARSAPEFVPETDPAVLQAELFPRLEAARVLVAKADEAGLFAPSVSDALEMMNRRAEGARRVIQTSDDPEEIERATNDLRRTAVLVTAYLGRIKGRLKQWVDKQVAFAKENPGTATLTATGLVELAKEVIAWVTPIFNELWQLIGNLPLPF